MSDFKYCKVNCGPHTVLFETETGDTICVWSTVKGSPLVPFDHHPKTAVYNIGMQFMIDTYGEDFGWGHMSEQALKDQGEWVEA